MSNELLGVPIKVSHKTDILEKIKKNSASRSKFFHVVSVNPENIMSAREDVQFKKIITEAQISILDGVGVELACRMLGVEHGERIAGVDLMLDMLQVAHERRLRVMLIGGGLKVADRVVKCQEPRFSGARFFSLEGISDIKEPKRKEEEKIFSIVADFKPHLLFAAFGSPWQEKWLWQNRASLQGIVCMGVGGAFDYLAGRVPRAPLALRRLGLEWLFRLIVQPWRWRRQLDLLRFALLVVFAKVRVGRSP